MIPHRVIQPVFPFETRHSSRTFRLAEVEKADRIGSPRDATKFARVDGQSHRRSSARRGREDISSVIKVRPRGNESIQQLLKRFKRLCQREGLTRDIKRHSYYEKPSERKRRQVRKAARKYEKDGLELPAARPPR